MSEVYYKAIESDEAGQRLDNYLVRVLKGVPKTHIYRIIRKGEVRVNKKRAQVSLKLESGDSVRIPPVRQSEEKQTHVPSRVATSLLDCVLYEDDKLLVLNKPALLAVHGGSGLSLGVIEALRHVRLDLPYLELVHRLDKETSGCLLLAKKRSALRAIQALLAERKVTKTYWALLDGRWSHPKKVVVNVPLLKNTLRSGERVVRVDAEGKPSETRFELVQNFETCCLVKAYPKTGRTHQIRVHSAHLGHPIVGDVKYQGLKVPQFLLEKSRLYLHAGTIQFTLDEKKYVFEAPKDERFTKTLHQLRLDR